MSQTFFIMSAEKKLLEFYPDSMKVIRAYEENSRLFPPLLSLQAGPRQLAAWLNSRVSPLGRKILNKVKHRSEGPLGILGVTLGLSLNDVWWISDGSHNWRDVNFYENKLDPDIAKAVFSEEPIPMLSEVSRSPEFSTGGDMAKHWFKRGNEIFLAKKDAPDQDGLCQTVMEWFAWQAAEAMGLEAVAYVLRPLHGDILSPVCECKAFTDIRTGFMPAGAFLLSHGAWNGLVDALSMTETHVAFAQAMGVEFYEDMMVFDALIGNSDRHLGNFGMLFDNNTGEVLRPAPLFDHGFSFAQDESCRSFSRERQLEIFVRPRHERMLETASHLEFKRHADIPVSEQAIERMQDYVHRGAKEALRLLDPPMPPMCGPSPW